MASSTSAYWCTSTSRNPTARARSPARVRSITPRDPSSRSAEAFESGAPKFSDDAGCCATSTHDSIVVNGRYSTPSSQRSSRELGPDAYVARRRIGSIRDVSKRSDDSALIDHGLLDEVSMGAFEAGAFVEPDLSGVGNPVNACRRVIVDQHDALQSDSARTRSTPPGTTTSHAAGATLGHHAPMSRSESSWWSPRARLPNASANAAPDLRSASTTWSSRTSTLTVEV